jgi:lipoprotein-releasing system ATP-binding protein
VTAVTTDRSTETVLLARGIRKSYPSPTGPLEVLRGVDLELTRGMLLAITGASGSGKTTLLNILGALDHATGGSLVLSGTEVSGLGERERCQLRAERVGFVFQFHHLLPEFTVEENVMMPLLLAGRNATDARARARRMLEAAGLRERWLHRPAEISGGEAQRVAVARALATGPELVLADEPTGNLDTGTASELHELMSSLAREEHRTLVVVTHNDRLAASADRVLRLEAGRLVPAA